MTPELYEKKRNELISLLRKAGDSPFPGARPPDFLSRICRRVQENQFEIVLAGEFQGGKSTTFNALCDGRELSPMGAGIKTSGCILSAQHLSDPEEAESAIVEWAAPAELIEGFSDLLLPRFRHLQPRRFEKVTASELPQILDLENPSDRKLLSGAADLEWKTWKKNRAAYDPEQSGLLDVLRCAILIARFYAAADFQQLRQKKNFRPEDAALMICFPPDWEERWADKHPERFRLAEILFVFIRRVLLKIHSPSLARLGCVITDCPGLLASRRDTRIARRAMFRADAVLYLFDGSKTLKMSDLHALDFIRKNGMAGKLFYGCNMRGHSLSDSRRILKAGIASLRNSGYSLSEEKDVFLFHALLSLRAVQGGSIAADSPKAQEIRKFLRRQMLILDADTETEDFPSLLCHARQTGGLDRMRDMVERSVISRRARSVLLENGAVAAVSCLRETEGNLHSRENAALREEKEFRRQAADTETELRKFRAACSRILEKLDTDAPDHALAADIWDSLEKQREELTDRTARRIYKEVAGRTSLSLLKKKRFQDSISGIIKAEIDRCFTECIHSRLAEIRQGENRVYEQQIVRRVRAVSRELKHAWSSSALPGMHLVEGTVMPEFSGDLTVDTAAVLRELESGPALENIRYSALLAAGGVTGIFTAASGALAAVYMLITRFFWLRIATLAAFLLNILLVLLTKDMMEKSIKEDIRRKLEPALRMLFYELREDVQKEFRNFSAEIRAFYRHIFQQAADKPRRVFEKRKEEAGQLFRKTREMRVDTAKKARQIREKEIIPLRRTLEEFIRQTEQHLPLKSGEMPQ
ncbi:MAG: dynamin family protein [Desulfococcaceae bacterium]|jgi:hypothetical protein|nr:dynamin family protein [Desulfococcaceae bacterium]